MNPGDSLDLCSPSWENRDSPRTVNTSHSPRRIRGNHRFPIDMASSVCDDGAMKIYHTTTAKLLPSILSGGLQTCRSQGASPVVWLHSADRTDWAMHHVYRRHGGKLQQIVRLTVDVPRSWLRRAGDGLWSCARDVPSLRILSILTWASVSRSPLERGVK